MILGSLNYLTQNVYDAAVERINHCFDWCDDIICCTSGGKDSTVLFELTLQIARERNRLPLKVFWLDQEAEWMATGDYVKGVMSHPEVEPWWFQVQFRMTNSLSPKNNFLYTWAPEAKDRWIRDQDPISVKENPVGTDKLFHPVIKHCPLFCNTKGRKHVGILVGMRMQESLNRRTQLMYNPAGFKGITWAHKVMIGNTRTFWPLYDWETNDVWTAIGRNGWTYNKVYDFMYQAGVTDMRVSSLIHETAWKNILLLQEFEPKLYDRYLARVSGVSCFTHFGKDMTPKRLPEVFCSWKEYRDYLLEHLIEPHYQPLFAHRWKGQDDLKWYKVHINEIMANDIDGTINRNHRSRVRVLARASSDFYKAKDEELFARLKITP